MDFKRHPRFTDLRVSNDGKIILNGEKPLQIKDHKQGNHHIKVLIVNRVRYSAAKLILECFQPYPTDGKRYYALVKDGNKSNLHPDNLYWGTNNLTPEQQFKRDCHLSKLGKLQTYSIFNRVKFNSRSKAFISKEYGVSAMSVKRAIDRLERKVKS